MNMKKDMLVMVGRENTFNESVFCNMDKSTKPDDEVANLMYKFLSRNVSGSVFNQLKKSFAEGM